MFQALSHSRSFVFHHSPHSFPTFSTCCTGPVEVRWLLLSHHGFLRGGVHLLLMPLRAASQLLRRGPGGLRTADGRDDVGAAGPGAAHGALAARRWELLVVAREKVL